MAKEGSQYAVDMLLPTEVAKTMQLTHDSRLLKMLLLSIDNQEVVTKSALNLELLHSFLLALVPRKCRESCLSSELLWNICSEP